jgi:hypothetical protein
MICVCLTLGPKHGLHLWAMESLIHGDNGSPMKKFLGIWTNSDSVIFVLGCLIWFILEIGLFLYMNSQTSYNFFCEANFQIINDLLFSWSQYNVYMLYKRGKGDVTRIFSLLYSLGTPKYTKMASLLQLLRWTLFLTLSIGALICICDWIH